MPQFMGDHYPAIDGVLSLLYGFFVGFTVRSASRKLWD